MNRTFILGCIFSAGVLGCGGNEAPSSGATTGGPAMSGTAMAAPAGSGTGSAAATGTAAAGPGCASVGCGNGKGDFFQKCDCKGKGMTPPLVAKWTGKMHPFFKEPTFEVENTSDKDIHWASASVYYYDKAGKQIEVKLKDRPDKYKKSSINGSNFTFKPKEKKELALGWKEENHPKDAVKIEVVFDGWCYGVYNDKANELCINVDRAPDERPASN